MKFEIKKCLPIFLETFLLLSVISGCSGTITNRANTAVDPLDDSGMVIEVEAADGEYVKLSEFTTSFENPAPGRGENITLASVKIDGTIIQPGEEFSYNETVGPTTKKNGFKLARIFIDGKDSKGYGGGVCQVSSTLYNAALEAGLEITERHDHSKPVAYVPEGKDAATSYGVIDLKFKNNKPYPVRINSWVMNESITVAIERVV